MKKLDSLCYLLENKGCIFLRKWSMYLDVIVKRHLHWLLNDKNILFRLKHVYEFNYVFMLQILHNLCLLYSIGTRLFIATRYFDLLYSCHLPCAFVHSHSHFGKSSSSDYVPWTIIIFYPSSIFRFFQRCMTMTFSLHSHLFDS